MIIFIGLIEKPPHTHTRELSISVLTDSLFDCVISLFFLLPDYTQYCRRYN